MDVPSHVEQAGGIRYAAFISYSHKDAAFGRWLHRRLEGYRLPRRLAGREGERGPVPARLTPIFRDRDELPAAGDLSERVRAALAISGALIVVCSPNSAASPWVAKEIATFRQLHPDRPIFAAIVEGEPHQCFPPDLRQGADGEIEPLAADFRKEADGRRLGILKLVSGIAGIGLDQLVQRDAQRRIRRVTAVTVMALVGMLATATMAIVAINARAEAQRQRREAEGLVEFMLTDLRDRLKGVGRLDVLTAVNRRALEYYQKQDVRRLPVDSLERRARILHAMGEDDETRGKLDDALAQFQEASRATSTLLLAHPGDEQRIYDHAQSEFWLGTVDYQRGRFTDAKQYFRRYWTLTEQLVASNPSKPQWQEEAAYAEGNLCSLALESPQEPSRALHLCSSALRRMELVQRLRGKSPSLTAALANRHGWMLKALDANNDWKLALVHQSKQEHLIHDLISSDKTNLDYQDMWMRANFGFAQILRNRGFRIASRDRFTQANAIASLLLSHDPNNATWKSWHLRSQNSLKGEK